MAEKIRPFDLVTDLVGLSAESVFTVAWFSGVMGDGDDEDFTWEEAIDDEVREGVEPEVASSMDTDGPAGGGVLDEVEGDP